MLQRSGRAVGVVEPCLPSPAESSPSSPEWIHEIKHDGFRVLARRDAVGVRIYTRNGNDFADRFSPGRGSVAALPMRSCLIDGEATVSDAGLAVFELIRSWRHDDAVLCTFDLLELDGEDLRRLPIEARKAVLAQLLRRPRSLAATAGRGNFKQSLNFTLCNFHKFIECEVCKCLRSHATNIRRSL